MSRQELPYDSKRVSEEVTNFFIKHAKGAEYIDLMGYLETLDPTIPEKHRNVMSTVAIRVKTNVLTRILVSEEVYKQWFGRGPRGGKQRGRYSVIFHSRYKSNIQKIRSMQGEPQELEIAGKKVRYDPKRINEGIGKFFDERPEGGEFPDVSDYLTNLAVNPGQTLLMAVFSKWMTGERLERRLVSKEVFIDLYGKEPRGTVQPGGLYKVYVHPKHESSIKKIERLQKRHQVEKNMELGLIPSLMDRILQNEMLDIIQECARGEGFLDVVVGEKIKHIEENINLRRAQAEKKLEEAEKIIEDTAAKFIKGLYTEADEIRKILEEAREKAEATRKKLNEKTSS